MTHSSEDAAPGLSAAALRPLRRLLNRKGREAADRFLAEGPQAVREAIAAGDAMEVIVDDPSRHHGLLAGFNGRVTVATEAQLRQLSETVTPQGVVAVCRQRHASLDDLRSAQLVVICAQVRDPGNAGTVIRCADAFGADAVVLSAGSVELHNPKTVRASVGSIFHLPIVTGVPLAEAVAHVKALGLQVLAADGDGERLDHMADGGRLAAPTAWMMGNEAWGLPEADASLADQLVAVPMWGAAESLNLSTAAAVCLYQTATAQRRGTEKQRSAHVRAE